MADLTIKQVNSIPPCFSMVQASNSIPAKQDSFESNKKEEYHKNNIMPYLCGIIGFFLPGIIQRPILKFIDKKMKTDEKLGLNFTEIKTISQNTYEKYKLKDKGIIYAFLGEKIDKTNEKIIKTAFNKESMNYNEFTQWIKNEHTAIVQPVKSKDINIKYVALATKENASLILHEFGHALNKSNKLLAIFSPKFFKKLPFIFFITGLVCTQKDKNKNQSNFNKIACFIKKHAGLLSFASFLPLLIDEALASKNALKFVNNNNALFSRPLRRNLAWALSSYFVQALTIVACVKLGLFIKDTLDKKYNSKKS